MTQSLSSLSFCFLIPLYQQANSRYPLQEYSDNQKGEGRAGTWLQVKQEFGSPEPTYKLDKHGGLCNPRAQELAGQSSLSGTSRLSKDPA